MSPTSIRSPARRGWWETMVGPGQPIDTERYFVICPNVVGACMGTTGPGLDQSGDRQAVGPRFPGHHHPRHGARAGDAARSSRHRHRCSRSPAARWAACRCCNGPRAIRERVFAALPIACATRHSAQNIAFHEVGRQAVMADPEWRSGRYFAEGTNPRRGLAVARMGAHITYLSDAALHRKFGRSFQDRDNPTFSFDADFQVESYLRHQGIIVRRALRRQFLSLSHARDGLFRSRRPTTTACSPMPSSGTPTRFCVISFTSRLAVPDLGIARHRACAQRRRRARLVRRDRHRQGPRRLPARRAGAVRDRARLPRGRRQGARASRRSDDDAVPAQARPHHGGGGPHARRRARRPAGGRRDGRAPAPRCSTSAAATASCCGCSARRATSTAAASSCRARASTNASPRGSR